ncbi:MAG: anaerobic ribonucleoside-triphosphate reductase activating protein [Veillonellaceae bacterium]|jgi:anaerobic ribonucleoside-triphosphate reductase activating protein|uniref:anaerobic ribonucleoside-triphosphate reductase activating protein n=1 Tax=uncultured Selenomonas sp. TaxID=159275 RepID=UPI0025EF7B3C|nr:anaerobic ribonucleoside-triphosphate reductase activating protein [uncultured Selenomonas sp.]MCI7539340.1 anaerobic ribonucleoside-triphosphate reductase activating protein [Veillonellaceae bacterium]MDD6126730.1 anaerobic ribonucleoside-triphosphate reductase activating protein [Veillonellaceae bacterium]MDD6697565.1 anaerobic ribonucleoside-triphosphate reductase activating protein [Veillonellaceae bacterium]MDY6350422.1 anaerobic ribonucleoside-triphosphate reductase activating protein 
MKLQIAGIVDDSIVDGDGCRLTVFVQGCARRCPGCQNPETQPMEGGHAIDTAAILQQMAENPILSGVTFSGGEPFLQPAPLASLARAVHQRGLDVWSYSGFTLEELAERAEKDKATRALLSELDVLVDGPYEEAQRDLTLHFRGSRNQRVIDMKKTRKAGRIVLLYTD